MGETMHKMKQVADDLKASWYFRFWLLSAIVFFFVGFSCLIILGAQSTHAKKEPTSYVWLENAKSLNYPRFHFRTNNGMTITNVSCSHNIIQSIGTGMCSLWNGYQPPMSQCWAVYAESIIVVNNPDHEFFDFGVNCNVTTIGNSTNVGNLIAWEMEGDNAVIGPDSYAATWVAPTNHAWILLQKGVSLVNKKTTVNDWVRKLQYQTTVSVPGVYNVRIIIEDFGVFHIDVTNGYNAWRALGDIGGFGFSMVLFHTGLMILIGLCFYNNASFLKSGGEEGHHQNIPSSEYQVINNKS